MARVLCPACGTVIPCIECSGNMCPSCGHDFEEPKAERK